MDRTWTDASGNHHANNLLNWDPNGAPNPNDRLIVDAAITPQPIIDISNNDLAGDTLVIEPSTVAHINTRGHSDLSLANVLSTSNVDIRGTLDLTADIQGDLYTTGGTMNFIGTSNFRGPFQAIFDNNHLRGPGTIEVSNTGTGQAGHMEFDASVGSRLTIDLQQSGFLGTSLQLDQPKHFHGLIEMASDAQLPTIDYIAFMGLHATSADLHNDMLRLFDCNKLVDTVRLSGGSNLQLQQNSVGVMLSEGFTSDQPGGPGTDIPLKIS